MEFLIDRIRMAMSALADNRRRTLLSIIGVATGIAAVTTVAAISRSGNQLVYGELESFGLSSVWVNRDYHNPDPRRRSRPGTGITNRDYDAMKRRCCRNVRRASAVVYSYGDRSINAGGRFTNARLLGVDSNFLTIENSLLWSGRGFRGKDIADKRKVALLGAKAADDLFERRHLAVGKTFRINGEKFQVIGVLEDKSRDFLKSIGTVRRDANNRILIPYTSFQKMLGSDAIQYVHAQANSLDVSSTAGEEIIAFLRRSNNGGFDYESETMAGYIATANRILGTVELVGIIAASISLIVGGLGIMNIMTTSVFERTREIGIRKAVGARRVDILIQFLGEAVIIGVVGGAIGVIVGLILSYALTNLFGYPLTTPIGTAAIGFATAFIVGLFSGLLPARRAASLTPVAALRYQ